MHRIVINNKDAYKLYKTIYYRPDEIFKYHPIYNEYIIGNCGTIIDSRTGYKKNLLNSISNKKGVGYARVKLRGKINKPVHRLVMETFYPNPDPEKYVDINHIDGMKRHNSYFGINDPRTNLEWCTRLENNLHAYRTGLNPTSTKYSKETDIKVCEGIEAGKTNDVILKELNLYYDKNVDKHRAYIERIRRKETKTNLSSKYNFPETKKMNFHEEWVVRKICELRIEGFTVDQISEEMKNRFNYEVDARFVRQLFDKNVPKKWKPIIDEYRGKFPKLEKYTKEQIDLICQGIIKFDRDKEKIAEFARVECDDTLKHKLTALRQRTENKDILEKYPQIGLTRKSPLTNEQAEIIYTMAYNGYSSEEIAKVVERECTQNFKQMIYRILTNKAFKHIKRNTDLNSISININRYKDASKQTIYIEPQTQVRNKYASARRVTFTICPDDPSKNTIIIDRDF